MLDLHESTIVANEKIVLPNSGGVTTILFNNPTIVRQKVQIYPGVTQASAGSKELSMNRIMLPAGMRGLRNMHKDTETVIYVLEDNSRTLIGKNGEIAVDNKAGDFIFIPANVWHQNMNISKNCVIDIEVHADADEQ